MQIANVAHNLLRQNGRTILLTACIAVSIASLIDHVPCIVNVIAKEQMGHADASRLIAFVTNENANLNGSMLQLPCDPMSRQHLPILASLGNLAIRPLASINGPRPNPARPQFRTMLRNRAVFINLLPKAIGQRLPLVRPLDVNLLLSSRDTSDILTGHDRTSLTGSFVSRLGVHQHRRGLLYLM